MIIFAGSRDQIFNCRNPNRVPKTPLKNPAFVSKPCRLECLAVTISQEGRNIFCLLNLSVPECAIRVYTPSVLFFYLIRLVSGDAKIVKHNITVSKYA